MAKKQTVVNEEDLDREDLTDEEEIRDEETDDVEDEEQVEEETDAAASLSPKSKEFPDPKSKLEVMKAAIGAIASASDDHLTKWWEQTVALVGHEGDKIPGGAAASNKASIDAKPSDAVKESVKEDLKALFDADKTLNEEARGRLETIFEAAVTARVLIEREQMEAEYEEVINEQVEEVKKEVEDRIESYLQYCTEQWMKENEVAVESALRSELSEEFMEGLRELFASHFISIPESKTDVVEALTEKVEELENALNTVIDENNQLKGQTTEAELIDAIEEVAEGLTVSQTEKLLALAEDVEFDGDLDNFKNKVGIIKETYFKTNGTKSLNEEDDFERTEEASDDDKESVVYTTPNMKRYAEKIRQTVKEKN